MRNSPLANRAGLCRWVTSSLATTLVAFSISVSAQQAADNTGANKQQQVTADQQSNGMADRTLTAKIRRSLIADKKLSMYAHNVKIIALNGAVTLKGPVKSEDEKDQVAAKAAEAAGGPDKVNNQLVVKGKS